MAIDPKLFRQVRKALGLTQAELAEQLGLSRVTVNKMEQGRLRRGIPDDFGAKLMALKVRDQGEALVVKTMQQGTHIAYAVKDDNHLWDNEEDNQ